MTRIGLTITAFLAVACSTEPPRQATSSKKDTESTTASNVESKDDDASSTGSFPRLLELKAQNDALCLRVQKQRVECPIASASLKTEDDQSVLGCVSGVDRNAKVETNFEINIQIPSGTKAQLTAQNGKWQTQLVGSGSGQKLVWGPRTKGPCDALPPRETSLVKSPRVLDLTDVMLIVNPEKCNDKTRIKTDDVSEFKVTLNGTELFSKQHLSDSGQGMQVALTKLVDFQQNKKCNVPKDELQKLMADAKSKAPKSDASTAPADLEAQLSREANRNDIMMKQLSSAENRGCWGYAKIKKLQVKIEGAALKNVNLGEKGSAGKDKGNAKEYTFTFGNNMIHTVPDESQVALFRSGGGFQTTDFTDREIQELSGIQIKKGGLSFQNDPFSKAKGCWHLIGCGTDSGFRVQETNIRSLSKISILANDQLIFEKSGISFTFQGDDRVWPKKGEFVSIHNSPEFMKLMARKDCPAD